MEISIRKSDLVRELQLVQGIVERKTSIPVLSNVLVEAKGAELKLAATDLDVSLRCGCAASVKKEGAVTLAAKKLFLQLQRKLAETERLRRTEREVQRSLQLLTASARQLEKKLYKLTVR